MYCEGRQRPTCWEKQNWEGSCQGFGSVIRNFWLRAKTSFCLIFNPYLLWNEMPVGWTSACEQSNLLILSRNSSQGCWELLQLCALFTGSPRPWGKALGEWHLGSQPASICGLASQSSGPCFSPRPAGTAHRATCALVVWAPAGLTPVRWSLVAGGYHALKCGYWTRTWILQFLCIWLHLNCHRLEFHTIALPLYRKKNHTVYN